MLSVKDGTVEGTKGLERFLKEGFVRRLGEAVDGYHVTVRSF